MRFPGFIGPSYESRSVNVDAQRTINLYPEVVESGSGKNKAVLYGTPGLATFCTLPKSPVRCLWAGDDRLFAVAGDTLYEVFSGGTYAAQTGAIAVDSEPAQIFPNGTQLLVVSGGRAYVDNGAGPVQCTFDGGGDVLASCGALLDGYFVVAKPDSGQIFVSGLNDGASPWDPTDVATAEAYADHIDMILADHQELWLFGRKTTEVWRNEGGVDFPLRRDPGGFIHQGIMARWSAVRLPGGPGWIGGDARGGPVAWMAQGFQPRRVSTHAVEQEWEKYSTVSDAVGYTYQQHGHTFWVLNFAAGNATWVYDVTTNLWHERAYGANRHRANHHAYVFDKHLVGDYSTGVIYEMDTDIYTDAGAAIVRTRTCPHISDEEHRIAYHRLQLNVEVGEISSPSFSLDWSNDGGHTWIASPIVKTGGAAGQYKTRILWRRLGASRDRVFRVTSSAAMRHAWIDAYLRLTGGTN